MKVEIFYMLLMTLGASLLAAALWTTRTMFRDRLGRAGAVGLYLSLAAFAGFFLTSVLAVATAILTGQPAEVFLPFGLALLLSIPGPILMGIGLSRVGELGVPRFLSFAVPVGAVLAFIDVNPVHDVGLGVLGLAWAGLGVGFLHRVQQEPKPVLLSALGK